MEEIISQDGNKTTSKVTETDNRAVDIIKKEIAKQKDETIKKALIKIMFLI